MWYTQRMSFYVENLHLYNNFFVRVLVVINKGHEIKSVSYICCKFIKLFSQSLHCNDLDGLVGQS